MKIKILFLILVVFVLPNTLLAFDWGECPFGNVNDPYPGLCGRFRDLDQDGLCDLSQTKPEVRGTQMVDGNRQGKMDKYNIILITVLVLLFYGLSEYLVYVRKERKTWWLPWCTPKNVRWFWNVVLLWSFIVVLITSLILLFELSGWIKPTKINYSFWHIEAGIVMIELCVVHVVKRWRHFVR